MNSRTAIRSLLVVATLVVIASIIAGMLAIGSPQLQRQHKFDERRVRDLATIAQRLKFHFAEHKELPPDLAALTLQPSLPLPKDPETGAAYQYHVKGADKYSLCATFNLAMPDETAARAQIDFSRWPHGSGLTCFDRNAITKPGSE
jgi:hypothetical protein